MKPFVKIALFVVLFIAVAGILAALIMYNKKHPDTAKAKPDFVVTATALQKEFEDNEKDASARYINKILEVTGTIASVTPDDSIHINISLKTGNEITLRGECSGYLMDVQLKNCAQVPVRKR